MAGIGFRLQRLIRSRDVTSRIMGLMASVALSCGPWLCTIISIALISVLSIKNLEPQEYYIFRIIINYTYAASLIGFSLLEMVTTRYVADMLYIRREKVIPTLYCRLCALVLAVSFVVGMIFYNVAGVGWHVAMAATILLSSVATIWCAMIFLTACKDFRRITYSFFLGMFVSIFSAYLLGTVLRLGLKGYLMGFTMGQIGISIFLSYIILSEFGTGFLAPRDYGAHLIRYRSFIFVGLFYSLSIWIDKITFWMSPYTSEQVAPYFYKSSAYDVGIFLSYLFIVPSMAYFLVKMETEFYLAYRRYFSLIDNRAPMNLIEKGRTEMLTVLRSEISGLVLYQSFVTLTALVFAREIIAFLDLPMYYTTVFRYGLLASALHVFLLFSNIVILYFNLPNLVVKINILFFVLNAGLSYFSTTLDYRFHGLGYLCAAFISLLFSAYGLNYSLRHLNFLVFMRQPLSKPAYLPLDLDNVSLK